MTGNRVWQMLARRTHAFLQAEPLREARGRLRRDPGRLAPAMDACLAALEAGRTQDALDALEQIIRTVGDTIGLVARAAAATPTMERHMSEFTITTATQEPRLETAMQVIYQWNYEPEVDELRNLYVKATEAQWVAERDLDWDRPIDHAKFATTPLGAALPIEQCSYWKSLSEETALGAHAADGVVPA